MDRGLKNSIAERFISILKKAETPEKFGQFPSTFSYRDGVALTLVGEGFEEYNEVLRSLLEDTKWAEIVSRESLDGSLRALISTMLKEDVREPDEAIRYLDGLIADIEGISETPTVYQSILGMSLDVDEFAIANVTLKEIPTRWLTN
jgi:hypothetical protein